MNEKKVLGLDPNVAYGLTYLSAVLQLGFIVPIILLCVDSQNRTSRFVALQSIFLMVAEIVLWITCVGWIVPWVFLLICCINAFQGKSNYKAWLIGDWAEKAAGD